METEEIIWVASVAIAKQLDYETLLYSDYMYGNTEFIDDVWEYILECREIGIPAFYDKYDYY